jgi:hypothetical protein
MSVLITDQEERRAVSTIPIDQLSLEDHMELASLTKVCEIEGCSRRVHGRGLCVAHYSQWRKVAGPQQRPTAEERFWPNVNKTETCWLWTGSVNNKGYGKLSFKGEYVYAHRFSMYLVLGRWPNDCILHSCDTPLCVNPDHLREGSQTENLQEMRQRHRHTYGERHPHAKLTQNQVETIRILLDEGVAAKDIADRFNISTTTVGRIRRGEGWAHEIVWAVCPCREEQKGTFADLKEAGWIFDHGEHGEDFCGECAAKIRAKRDFSRLNRLMAISRMPEGDDRYIPYGCISEFDSLEVQS